MPWHKEKYLKRTKTWMFSSAVSLPEALAILQTINKSAYKIIYIFKPFMF